ncbi:hypothetical protein J4407_01910 [Candidatus Pacearchaeota archaeon]|nr:hypothetical protein [Candidatus Pacearchaeota archaeon]
MKSKLDNIIGKEVTIGFGRDKNRLVVLCENYGMTFYPSETGIEIGDKEDIVTKITPKNVKLEEYSLAKKNSGEIKIIGFRLGKHRFLSAQYCNDDKGIDLHIVYLPDEQDLEYGGSEFMNQCEGRGMI